MHTYIIMSGPHGVIAIPEGAQVDAKMIEGMSVGDVIHSVGAKEAIETFRAGQVARGEIDVSAHNKPITPHTAESWARSIRNKRIKFWLLALTSIPAGYFLSYLFL